MNNRDCPHEPNSSRQGAGLVRRLLTYLDSKAGITADERKERLRVLGWGDGSRVGLVCENCDCLLLQAVHDGNGSVHAAGSLRCLSGSNPIVWAYGR